MTDCRELEPLLAPYTDGQIPPEERARVEAHIEACGRCRDRVLAQRAVCDSLNARRSALRSCAPEDLKTRCAAYAARNPAVSGAARPAAPFSWPTQARRWVPLTAAATILLAMAAVFGLGLNNKVEALAVQATIDHAACSRLNMQATAADPLAAAQRWQERWGWPITVPASTGEGAAELELRAVRRCAVLDGRVAHILYIWKGEPLSVYVLPKAVVARAPAFVRRFGHDAVVWSQNDRTYLVISNRQRDEALDRVVSYVRANAY